MLPFAEKIDGKQFIVFPFLYYTIITVSHILARVNLKDLVVFLISLHLIFFFIQLLSYFLLDYRIDFVVGLTGEESRNLSGQILTIFGKTKFRPSGLFVEPGTYSVYIAPLLACLKGLIDGSKKRRNIYYLGIASLFLSYSLYGVFFALILFVIEFSGYVKNSIKKVFSGNINVKDLLISSLFFISIFLIVTYSFSYIETRFSLSLEDSGIGLRQGYISSSYSIVKEQSPFWPYLNLGIFNKFTTALDIGFINYYFFVFGIIPYATIIFFVLIKYVKNLRNFLYIINHKLPILIFFLFTFTTKFSFFTVTGATYLSIALATSSYIDNRKNLNSLIGEKKTNK
jgi:hypothetical protein